jgi:hypothetical protein
VIGVTALAHDEVSPPPLAGGGRGEGAWFLLAVLVGAAVAVGYFLTAPKAGDFAWADAPRHALNGVFIRDFLAAMPFGDPKGFAFRYYAQYPALTILFYPPLFYVVEAAAYAIGGVSEATAIATEAAFAWVLTVAAYGFGRLVLPPLAALGFAVLLAGSPEIMLWGRQVMLDLPCEAMLMVAAWCFLRYLRDGAPAPLYAAAAALLAAVYIKFNAVFLLPVFGLAFLVVRGGAGLRDRRVLATVALTVVLLVPGVLLNLKFGSANLQSVAGRPGDLARDSLASWLYYLKLFPAQLGWPAALLAVPGLALLLARPRGRIDRLMALLAVIWLVAGYLLFSALSIKESRVTIVLLPPLALAAVYALVRLLPRPVAGAAALALGCATFGWSLLAGPTPHIGGFPAVADYVAAAAPHDGVVVFSGYRDGNFVFAMRTHGERPDISTVRSDKFLLQVSISRRFGITQTDLTEADIAAMLRGLGTDLVVVQPGFWGDLAVMQRFERVMHSPDFARVASFPLTGTLGEQDGNRIDVYKPTYPVDHSRSREVIGITAMGREIR